MRSFLLNLPGFKERIGPVKAPALRVASRLVNTLRAGRATNDFADFDTCRLVFVCVPDENLADTMTELIDARIDWAGRSVVLCDSMLPSTALKRLASRGAYTASASYEADTVIVDGHESAVAEVKMLVGRWAPLIRIAPSSRTCLLNAVSVAALSRSLAAIADECARTCGLTATEAKRMVETVLAAGLKDFVKAGRKVLINDPNPAMTKKLRTALACPAKTILNLEHLVRGGAAEAGNRPV